VDASDALVDFLQDPGTDGLNIALRFFPSNLPLEGCVDENADSDLSCSTSACEQPLVNVGLVTSQAGDPQETLLVSAIQEASPGSGVQGAIDDNGNPDYQRGGGTPISAALGGAIQWSAKYQQQHTDQKTVVVFVTDGEPYGCNESTTAIAALAAEGSNAGIPTYSIGLEGSAEDLMRAIAQSGGTGDPFFIGSGDNASQDLLQALNEIRGKALSCDFEVPDSNGGGQINPNQVNVTLTAGGATNSFFKVESADDCDSSSAWYYDNNANPTRMILCQAACDQVLSQADASLEIVFGCATTTTPPMQN
jgi:hypothetical protein